MAHLSSGSFGPVVKEEMSFKYQGFSLECVPKNSFSYFSSKPYVVGTQKNRRNETVLLSTQNICSNLWIRKYLQFYSKKICLSKPMNIYLFLALVAILSTEQIGLYNIARGHYEEHFLEIILCLDYVHVV